MNYTQKPKLCSNVRHGKKQIIRTRKKQIITARREIEDLRNDTHTKKELDNWQRVKYFLVVGRFPAGRERNKMNDYIKGKIDALEQVAEFMPEIMYTDVYRDLVDEMPKEELNPAYIIGELERYGLRARTELLGGGLVGVWIDLKLNHYGLITNGYGLGVYDSSQIEYDRLRFDDLAEDMAIGSKLKLMATVLNYYGQPDN